MDHRTTLPVYLEPCRSYKLSRVADTVSCLLEAVGCLPNRGTRVLVKPNLLAPALPDCLPCTHVAVIASVCRYLHDCGAQVIVGDSPSLGQGVDVAKKIGLAESLGNLPVKMVNLNQPKFIKLPSGGRVALSRKALESDFIINLPKLKAHHQMRITGAVKNIYGCVPGFFKPLFHLLYGDRRGRFRTMIFDIWKILPPSVSLMDAIVAMHVQGPVKGKPFELGLLASSPSPIALDSAVMNILGLSPQNIPFWHQAQAMKLPGARIKDLSYPSHPPEVFATNEFLTPDRLFPVSFRPIKLLGHLFS